MGELLAVLRREFDERVRTRWFAYGTLFGPILFAAILFLPPYLATRSAPSRDVARIAIIDATGTGAGRGIAVELGGGLSGDTAATQVIETIPDSVTAYRSAAEARIARGAIKGVLVLERSSLNGDRVLYVGRNTTALADMQHLEGATAREIIAARLRNAGLPPDEADRLKGLRPRLQAVAPQAEGRPGRLTILGAFAVAVLLYLSIFLYGQNVLRSVIEEKQSRVAEVVLSSVSPNTLLWGKVLGVGAVGLTQLTIWLAAYYILALVRRETMGISGAEMMLPMLGVSASLLLLLFFVLGYTLYAALYATVGATVSSEHDAQQAQLPVAMLLVLTIAMLPPIVRNPDGTLAVLLSWVPFSAPIIMPLRMTATDVSAPEIAFSLISIAAACYVAVWVAARVYRAGMLMYGKRASVREIVRWLVTAGR